MSARVWRRIVALTKALLTVRLTSGIDIIRNGRDSINRAIWHEIFIFLTHTIRFYAAVFVIQHENKFLTFSKVSIAATYYMILAGHS